MSEDHSDSDLKNRRRFLQLAGSTTAAVSTLSAGALAQDDSEFSVDLSTSIESTHSFCSRGRCRDSDGSFVPIHVVANQTDAQFRADVAGEYELIDFKKLNRNTGDVTTVETANADSGSDMLSDFFGSDFFRNVEEASDMVQSDAEASIGFDQTGSYQVRAEAWQKGADLSQRVTEDLVTEAEGLAAAEIPVDAVTPRVTTDAYPASSRDVRSELDTIETGERMVIEAQAIGSEFDVPLEPDFWDLQLAQGNKVIDAYEIVEVPEYLPVDEAEKLWALKIDEPGTYQAYATATYGYAQVTGEVELEVLEE
jgi:hypothetical protein